MARPSAIAAVTAATSVASSGFVYASKDEPFLFVVVVCAVLAVVFGALGSFAADES